MSDNNDVFRMLAAEDKLDGKNYPLWSYMMRHVLVAKALWNVVIGVEVHPASREESAGSAGTVEDDSGASSSRAAPIVVPAHKNREGGMAEMRRHMLCLHCLSNMVLYHIFAHVKLLRMHGIHLLHCIKFAMRQMLHICVSN